MTSPGGRIVGRVGVRVLPNTSSFKKSLERYLKRVERTLRVELPTVLDTKGLDADLKALKERISRSRPAKIPVEFDTPVNRRIRAPDVDPAQVKLTPQEAPFHARIRAMLAEIEKNAANIPLTAKGETFRREVAAQVAGVEKTVNGKIPFAPDLAAGFRRELQAKVDAIARTVRGKATIDVDVDRDRTYQLTNYFTRVGGGIGRALSGAASTGFRALVNESRTFGSVFSDVASSTVSGIGGIIGALVSVLFTLGKIAVGAGLVSVAVAGIAGAVMTAAGAISAGLGGLPVLLSAIAAPIASIIIGFDGITKAAEKIRPEMTALKAAVVDVFERGFGFIFEMLKPVFPVLQEGLALVASGVVTVATGFADLLRSEGGILNLRDALGGVFLVIRDTYPMVQNLLSAMLAIAGTRELYEILASTISRALAPLVGFLERIGTNQALTAALWQLRDVLAEIMDWLVAVMEGALDFFVGAGPGITGFFHEMARAVLRIDWRSLGETFGGLLERIGAAMNNVSPETWSALGAAISGLADDIVSFIESGGLELLVDGLTKAVQFTRLLIQVGEAIANSGFIDTMWELARTVGDAVQWIIDKISGFMQWLGIASPSRLFASIGEAMLTGLLNGLNGKLGEVGAWFAALPGRILSALGDLGRQMYDAGSNAVMSFLRGLGSKLAEVGRKAAEIAQRAYNAAKSALGISSPSRVFAAIGHDTIQGFLVGLRDRITAVLPLLRTLFDQVAARAAQVRPVFAATWDPESVLAAVGPQLNTSVHSLLIDAARASQRTRHRGDDPETHGGGQSTADELTRAFLAALQQVAVSGDQIAILADRARTQMARR